MIRKSLRAVVFSTLFAGALVYLGSAIAQQGPLEIVPLAQGFSSDRHVRLQGQGPSDVLYAKLVLQPLGQIGWHTHPGPVVVVVTKGALTEYSSKGCITLHPAGSAFFEMPGEVHKVINHDAANAVEGYATFILPIGNPPLQPATEPQPQSCSQEPEH